MLVGLVDPNGEIRSLKECLEEGALDEWYPRSYVAAAADVREWRGKASVTQGLNGTRLEFFKILVDYVDDPAESAFKIIGTRGHGTLEKYAKMFGLAEKRLEDPDISGILDSLEQWNDGSWVLTDYKTWGAYRVMRALGATAQNEPVLGADGEPTYYKSGQKKGQMVTKRVVKIDSSAGDLREPAMQLNRYRILAKDELGIDAARMRIFAIVRDGGTANARGNNVTKNTYMIPVERIDDEKVLAYFGEKSRLLVEAVAKAEEFMQKGQGRMEAVRDATPAMCTEEENWRGRRCQGYCPVATFCKTIGDNPHL